MERLGIRGGGTVRFVGSHRTEGRVCMLMVATEEMDCVSIGIIEPLAGIQGCTPS